jgi:hypothetical protein
MRTSEKSVLRIIFGPKGEGIRRGLERFLNEELHNVYYS